MKWFANRPIRTKLLIAFLLIGGLICGLGTVAIQRLGEVNDAANDLATNWMPSIKHLGHMAVNLNIYRRAEMRFIMASDDPVVMKETEVMYRKARELYLQHWKDYQARITPGRERELADEIQPLAEQYFSVSEKLLALARGSEAVARPAPAEPDPKQPQRPAESKEALKGMLFGDHARTLMKLVDKIEEIIDFNERGGVESAHRAASAYRSAYIWILTGSGVAVLLALSVGFFLASVIAKPLHQAVAVLNRQAQADFSGRLDLLRKDEVGQMAQPSIPPTNRSARQCTRPSTCSRPPPLGT